MNSVISKWGNSLAIRIPANIARDLRVVDGAAVDISLVDGALVMRPVDVTPTYDLDALLDGITQENRHGEIATGGKVGNEF